MRNFLTKELNRLDILEEELVTMQKDMDSTRKTLSDSERALVIMQKAAKLSQEYLAKHLSKIVTSSVRAVIKEPYTFVCEFVERRGSAEADLYLEKDGNQYDILGSTGGGLADVCSLTLKIAYLLLSNKDRVLIIDEPIRHINSAAQRRDFVKVIKELSQEFGIQLILISTLPELLTASDNTVTLVKVDGITKIEEVG